MMNATYGGIDPPFCPIFQGESPTLTLLHAENFAVDSFRPVVA
ncbi:hypothetical protein DFR47_104319 [Pseudochrobactrum asaccharolyticum]|uniref:Uncharacterized protein n=1 Tax=Pseudochrobactrum asaccharolyticum TaxID=354351 RepID=A0A366DY23_9HYPH|nr:hypothetical protein DFR47_104319 [Pseudochrobactrum asaccharolyticum]